MKGLLKDLPKEALKKLRLIAQPSWVSPILATHTNQRFSDKDWIFKQKLDGERCLAFRQGSRVSLLSCNQKQLNDTYPELLAPLLQLKSSDYIVDGEIVAFEGSQTSFSLLQPRSRDAALASGINVYY